MSAPHCYWQTLEAPGTHDTDPPLGFIDSYPVTLDDGRQLLLPLRELPAPDTGHAVASLILNQASFDVQDALGAALAELIAPHSPDVVIGVPTLGLPLAGIVARRLGHQRLIALGNSRKFWYDDELSAPLSSITTPNQTKRVFLDPRLLPLVTGVRVAVVDDVISSGASMAAVLSLLQSAGVQVEVIGAAMLQSEVWRGTLARAWAGATPPIVAPLRSPFLARTPTGSWLPEPLLSPAAT